MFYSDPQSSDFAIDPITGLVPAWIAYRQSRGELLCHPVPINAHFQDRDLFLSAFTRPYNLENTRDFMRAFPPFDGGDYFTWYARVVGIGQSWLAFFPPSFTLRDGLPCGTYFDGLPFSAQLDVQNLFPSLIAQIIRYKDKGFISSSELAPIVQQSDNGYEILYNLAVHFGHPLLQRFPKTLNEPKQDANCSLAEHLRRWASYLQHQALHGHHYSDRYFMQQLCASLHPALHSTVVQWLEMEVHHFFLEDPLPAFFSPTQIYTLISQRLQHVGRPRLATSSPREFSQSTALVREVVSSEPSDDSIDFIVAAISSSPAARSCFMCGDPNHVVLSCPRFTAARNDPYVRRTLVKMLEGTPASSKRPASSAPRKVNALLDDDSDAVDSDDPDAGAAVKAVTFSDAPDFQ
jgi:hypothetical protein